MRIRLPLLGAALSLSLVLGTAGLACDSGGGDDGDGTVAPVEPGSDGSPQTGPEPEPEPGPTGACDNDADLDAISTTDEFDAVIGNCAFKCFGQDAACSQACLVEATGMSEGCATCFAGTIACTLEHCATSCLDPSNPDCAGCQDQHCFPAFEECAGVLPQ